MSHSAKVNEYIGTLVSVLFKAEDKRLRRREIEIVAENRTIFPAYSDGFFYEGRFYTDLDSKLVSKGVKAGIHPSMVQIAAQHVIDRKQIEFDRARIKQALALSMKGICSYQDLRDVLPEQIADTFTETLSLSRIREEAFTLADEPKKLAQYHKLREKIEFYSIARMLY
jgi:hypothetical protein